MKPFLENLIVRLQQESTWRGLIQAGMAFGLTLEPAKQTAIISIGMFLLGSINIAKDK